MTDITAGELTAEHRGRFVRFTRPGDVLYGKPIMSGPLRGFRQWRNGSGREIVSVTVGQDGEMDLSPRHPIHVGHVWRERPGPLHEYNLPPGEEAILHARLHGGPFDGKRKLLAGDGEWWDGGGVTLRTDACEFAYYEHSHVPEGVERPASPTQRRHGLGPTVFHGTVHMKYKPKQSATLNELPARRK